MSLNSGREDLVQVGLGMLPRCGANDTLLGAFVQRIIGHRVETQKSVDRFGQLDLWLEAQDESGQRHLLVVENKIGAPADPAQLARYASYLATQTHAASRTLLFVSPRSPSGFRPSTDDSLVKFRECRWYRVYDWLKEWVDVHGRQAPGSSVLAKELLTLMEEWNMDMKLSAADLAVATTYKLSAQKRLYQVLNEVHEACKIELLKSAKGRWNYDYSELIYSSPTIGDKGVHIEFGFDFGRKDEDWDVSRLGLPSAYFAIRGEGVGQQYRSVLPDGWKSPPSTWGWPKGERVKQLSPFKTGGSSLRNVYLRFFLDALAEAHKAFKA